MVFFSHVEFQQFLHGVGLAKGDLLQAHVLADEMTELIGRDFSQSFEFGDFRIRTQSLDGSHCFCPNTVSTGFVHAFLAIFDAGTEVLGYIHDLS